MWIPPPAAADVVVEHLGEARHKRPNCMHITIVRRLITSRWRRGLLKASDLKIVIPVGCVAWSKDQHEPLLMFISFPLCRQPLGASEARITWKAFVGSCAASGTLCQTGRGLFCANYSNARESLMRPMLSGDCWTSLSDLSSDRRGRIRKRDRGRC